MCFYSTQSNILLCGITKFGRGNKNKLRTFQPQKWKKIKNSQPQTKFTGSYKKKCVFGIVLINFSKDFLNILYNSELRISKLNLFHSLIVSGKKSLKIFGSTKKSVWYYYYFDLTTSILPTKTHHVYSTLKLPKNGRKGCFNAILMWNTRCVLVGFFSQS